MTTSHVLPALLGYHDGLTAWHSSVLLIHTRVMSSCIATAPQKSEFVLVVCHMTLIRQILPTNVSSKIACHASSGNSQTHTHACSADRKWFCQVFAYTAALNAPHPATASLGSLSIQPGRSQDSHLKFWTGLQGSIHQILTNHCCCYCCFTAPSQCDSLEKEREF